MFFSAPAQAAEEVVVDKKKIVILGSGWGATSVLKGLKTHFWETAFSNKSYEVVVVSPRNYFLFTPLLPGCTVGTLENFCIATPIRVLLKKVNYDISFYEAACTDVDFVNNRILCSDTSEIVGPASTFTIDYDYLVVGVGSTNSTFGTPGVTENACFLKSIEDATKIRTRIVDCFETANYPTLSEDQKRALLSFV